MSKRFKLFLILVLLVVAVMFLFPTINWYFLIPETKRAMATSTNTQIKDYALGKANEAVKEIKGQISRLLTKEELLNPKGLVKVLKDGESEVAKLVKGLLSDKGAQMVNSFSDGTNLSDEQLSTLVDDLNLILKGKHIFTNEVFADMDLTKSTRRLGAQALAKKNIEGKYIHLNRFLLEESFPGMIDSVYLDRKYDFLTKKVKTYYKSIKVDLPSKLTVKAVLNAFFSEIEILEAFEDYYREEIMGIKAIRNTAITLGLDLKGGISVTVQADFDAMAKDQELTLNDEDKKDAIGRALEVLNNRIDQFSLTEPVIRPSGTDRIEIQLPGMADPERIKNIILGKGRLNFHIVDTDGSAAFREYYQQNPGDYLADDGKSLKDPNVLPAGTILRELVEKDKYGVDQRKGFTVLKEEIGLSGNYVTRASVSTDPRTLRPLVLFEMSVEGQEKFYTLTKENIKKTMAVVLDDKVKFQATIQDAIRGGVQVAGQGLTSQEANDLAKVLKTGALPVPLTIISQEAVGASLGAEAIQLGLYSIALGIILVMVFMLIYYKGGGVITNISLLLNFFFLTSILSVLHFTLTLPSFAGVILTVGMAVDANVIIFERIKEEYKIGKGRKSSIKAGFAKAFSTILDANVTTAIAALALAYFGKGPIRGFATVLTIGIVCSLFTALFISRLIFDFVTDVFKASKLSLSWGGSK